MPVICDHVRSMEKSHNGTDRKTVRVIIVVIITLLCFLIVIGGLNRPHLNPFTDKLQTVYPTSLGYNDSGSAIIDNQGRRILITGSDGKLTTVIDTTKSGSPIDQVNSLTIVGDRIFALGYCCYDQGAYLSSESVIEYNMRGNMADTVYTEKYSPTDKINRPRFSSILTESSNLYMITVEGNEVALFRIDRNAMKEMERWTLPEAVYIADSVIDTDGICVVGVSRNCYWINCKTGEISNLTRAEYIATLLKKFNIAPSSVNIRKFEDCYYFGTVTLNLDGKAQYYSVIDPDGNAAIVLSNGNAATVELAGIRYSAGFMIKNILYWLAAAIIGIEAIALIVWLFIKKLTAKGKIVFAIIGAILLTSVFYTNQIFSVTEKSYNQSLVSQTRQMSYTLTEVYGDILSVVRDVGIHEYSTDLKNQADIQRLQNALKTMCDINETNQSCYATCYLFDKEGNLFTFADSGNVYMAGMPVTLSEDVRTLLQESSHVPINMGNYLDTVVFDYDCIYSSEGEIVGVLTVAGKRGNLIYLQSQMIINMAVSLTTLFIGGYVTITLFKSCATDFKRRKLRDSSDIGGRRADMAGIFAFTRGMIYGLDNVIVVYVARSLCADVSITEQATMIALPVTMAAVGQMLGDLFTASCIKRFGDRTVSIFASITGIAAMLVCAFAIAQGNIYIYMAGKFFTGMVITGSLYVQSETIPYHAKDEVSVNAAAKSTDQCFLASMIISALTGGYVSQYLSYRAIYLLGGAMCVIMLVLCIVTFGRKASVGACAPKAAVDNGKKDGGYFRFFLRKPVLLYLLLISLPYAILNGYKYYLFPLYTASAGISALLLSNLSVFARTLSFLLIDPLNRFILRQSAFMKYTAPVLITCVGFLCFYISPNIYWAIAMLFVNYILMTVAKTSGKLYMLDMADLFRKDSKTVETHYVSLRAIIETFQTPVLSAAVSLGMNMACTVVGAVLGLMCGGFAVFDKCRRRKIARANDEAVNHDK